MKKQARKAFPPFTVIKLWVRAGGRCEFNGCNDYLLVDSLTLNEANYSNIGHIVANSKKGPRGNDPLLSARRNNIENLMLLCTKHHKMIDTKALERIYPKELLQKYKFDHEKRIRQLTGKQPGNKTVVIRMKSKINGEPVQISLDQIRSAVHPRYPVDEEGLDIDFTSLPDEEGSAYWDIGKQKITTTTARLYQTGMDQKPVDHISVFGLGPIPLLMYLGNQLSNKITTDLYQRHRDTQDWEWKTEGKTARYKVKKLFQGKDKSKVALMLSLSGTIYSESLPEEVKNNFTVYLITLDGQDPNTWFLKRKEDLITFGKIYQQTIAMMQKMHGGIKEVLLFPAIPAPIAIMCGRDLLKKVHPSMKVYDYNKKSGGFRHVLTIN
jgi:hypothetical protein